MYTAGNGNCQTICCVGGSGYSGIGTSKCCIGKEIPLGPDENRTAECCEGDPQCEACLASLMEDVTSTLTPGGISHRTNGGRCFNWLEAFLKNYPEYDPTGPIGTAGKISLCHGKIILEPQTVPVRGKAGGNTIVTRRHRIFGRPTRAFSDHGIVKVTIGKCISYFDIGAESDQGNFGGDDRWFFPDYSTDDGRDFLNFMDLPKADCYFPIATDLGD